MNTNHFWLDSPSHHFFLRRHRQPMRNTSAPGVGGTGGGTPTSTGSDTGGSGAGAGTSGSQSDGGTGGQGTGSGTSAGTGSQPSGTSGSQSTETGDVDGVKDGDFRTLRTKYGEVKAKAAQLESLGVPFEQAQVAAKQFVAMRTEVNTTGTGLGYDQAEIDAAFAQDPIGTINLLRKEKAEADAGQNKVPQTPEEQAQWLKDEVARQTKPYTEHINQQISDAVTAKIGTEFNTHYEAALPNTPTEIRSLVEDYTIEYLKASNSDLVAMKARGDYSAVKKVVDTVAARLKTAFTAWTAAEIKRAGGRSDTTQGGQQGGQQTQQTGKRPTLDEMIANPGLINSKYGE